MKNKTGLQDLQNSQDFRSFRKSCNHVLFLEHLRVMRDVAGDYVGERANGEGVIAGDSRT